MAKGTASRLIVAGAALVLLSAAARAQGPSVCPDDFMAYAGTSEAVSCTCSGEAVAHGSVWGMDHYTGDSSVCRAALHAGIVGPAGGAVTVISEPGRPAYAGVTRNGVASSNYGFFRTGFRFAAGDQPPLPDPSVPGNAAGAGASQSGAPEAAVSICPDNFEAYAGTADPLHCSCPAEATARGSVWGTDHYTGDSAICRAALHAGAVDRAGGTVTVVPEPGRAAYPGVTRNGIASSNYGAFHSSYRFATAQWPAGAAASPAGPSVCPDNFTAFAGTTAPLQCICSAEAAARGSVWGMDHYTGDSGICRAAVHAGVITGDGGTVTVQPEPGRAAYPGVTRNGVQSSNYGAYSSSFRFGAGLGK